MLVRQLSAVSYPADTRQRGQKLPLRLCSVRTHVFCKAGKQHRRKAKRPGLFEVLVVTPPKESLGIHAFPPDTHNGDQIKVEGKDFVVSSLVLQYKLVGGRYERDHNRLDVQELSRYFLNLHLDSLLDRSYPKEQ